jgi:DNA-binding XRE family transcriptional regulator
MNKKHIGSSVFETIKEWEKDPVFRKAVDEHVEKAKLAKMLKDIRKQENISQLQLAEKANVTQSVIARIETGTSKTLPRLDLFNRILHSVGYETLIVARKKGRTIQVTLAA